LHPRASKQSRPCSTYTRSRHTEIGTVSLPASSRWVRVTAVYYELYYMRSQQSRSGGSYETLASSIPLSLPKYNQVSCVPQSGHPTYAINNSRTSKKQIKKLAYGSLNIGVAIDLCIFYFRTALCFILVYNCGVTVRNKRICYVMLCYAMLATEHGRWPRPALSTPYFLPLYFETLGLCQLSSGFRVPQ